MKCGVSYAGRSNTARKGIEAKQSTLPTLYPATAMEISLDSEQAAEIRVR